jgi:hypothetical protein
MTGIHKIYRRDDQPFAQVPNSAIRDPEISPNAFRLLAYLMSHQDGYGLTYQQIERQTALGRFAINGAIQNLTAKGWLKTESTTMPDGRFGPKAWYVLNPDSRSSEHLTSVGNSTAVDSTVEQPTDNKNTTLEEEHLEEVITHSSQIIKDKFEEFWEAYPLKKGKNDALRAFTKASRETDPDCIAKGAHALAMDPNLPPKQFIPYPATWINRAGWEDEPYPERERTKEELEAIRKAQYERQKVKDREQSQRLLEDARRAKETASAPPQCQHGSSIVRCKICLRANAT